MTCLTTGVESLPFVRSVPLALTWTSLTFLGVDLADLLEAESNSSAFNKVCFLGGLDLGFLEGLFSSFDGVLPPLTGVSFCCSTTAVGAKDKDGFPFSLMVDMSVGSELFRLTTAAPTLLVSIWLLSK